MAKSLYFNKEHEMVRRAVREFVDNEINPNVDEWEEKGETPLHAACGNGHVVMAALLLQRGANIDTPNGDGYAPIHRAAASGNVPGGR